MEISKKLIQSSQKPNKQLIKILPKNSGRNNSGKITVRHQGGRQKRYYRLVDFRRDKRDVQAEVVGIEYDPNRNAHIALVRYDDRDLRYILHPQGLTIGDKIIAGDNAAIKVGNALPLKNIPLGIEVHNIELYPGKGGQFLRSAGSYGMIVAKEGDCVHLKLPSKEVRRVLNVCYATIGKVGNIGHKEEIIGRAGRKILMGIRPTVRGVAQNPYSHPHGGGEGRVGEGMHPKTPWGKPARGKKTRKKNKWGNKLIVTKRR